MPSWMAARSITFLTTFGTRLTSPGRGRLTEHAGSSPSRLRARPLSGRSCAGQGADGPRIAPTPPAPRSVCVVSHVRPLRRRDDARAANSPGRSRLDRVQARTASGPPDLEGAARRPHDRRSSLDDVRRASRPAAPRRQSAELRSEADCERAGRERAGRAPRIPRHLPCPPARVGQAIGPARHVRRLSAVERARPCNGPGRAETGKHGPERDHGSLLTARSRRPRCGRLEKGTVRTFRSRGPVCVG